MFDLIVRQTLRPLVLGLAATAALGACGRSGDIDIVDGLRLQSKIVDATADVGFYSDLELDADGTPTISYYDYTNGDLKFARLNRSTGQWELSVIDEEGDVGGFTDLEYDALGNPHVVYYDYTNAQVKYALFNGLEWEIRVLGDFPGAIEGFTAMKIDTRLEAAHIAAISAARFDLEWGFYDWVSDTLVPYTVDRGTDTTGRGGNINKQIAVGLRRQGDISLPLFVYYHASYGLLQLQYARVATGGGYEFVPRILDGTAQPNDSDIGQWAKIWMESDDVMHISYFDATNQDLFYGRYQFSTDEFVKERVDADGIVGESTSITLDARGRPVITYFDSTNNDLKLAVRSEDGRWQLYRVDLRGVVGTFSSVRLLPSGQLGISYRNSGREALIFTVVQTN